MTEETEAQVDIGAIARAVEEVLADDGSNAGEILGDLARSIAALVLASNDPLSLCRIVLNNIAGMVLTGTQYKDEVEKAGGVN